jgi:hypothetical protein
MRLCDYWGEGAVDVVDHWEANMHGVGVAQTMDHSVLAYIDTFGKTKGTYYVELEVPPSVGSGQPFKSAGVYDTVNFEELRCLVGQHLRLEDREKEIRDNNPFS